MNRRDLFRTLGFLGAGVIVSKIVPEIKEEPVKEFISVTNGRDVDWIEVKEIHGMFDDKYMNGDYKLIIPKDRNLLAFIEDIKGQRMYL